MPDAQSIDLDANAVAEHGKLRAFLEAIVSLLQQHRELAAAKIMDQNQGDIAEAIEEGIAQTGLNLIVILVSGESSSDDAFTPFLDTVQIAVRVMEDPLTNREAQGTRVTADRAVELVASHLQQAAIGNNALVFRRFRSVSDDGGMIIKDVIFETSISLGTPTE